MITIMQQTHNYYYVTYTETELHNQYHYHHVGIQQSEQTHIM